MTICLCTRMRILVGVCAQISIFVLSRKCLQDFWRRGGGTAAEWRVSIICVHSAHHYTTFTVIQLATRVGQLNQWYL